MPSLLGQPVTPSPVVVNDEEEDLGPVGTLLQGAILHAVGLGVVSEIMEAAHGIAEVRGQRKLNQTPVLNLNPALQLDPSKAFIPK